MHRVIARVKQTKVCFCLIHSSYEATLYAPIGRHSKNLSIKRSSLVCLHMNIRIYTNKCVCMLQMDNIRSFNRDTLIQLNVSLIPICVPIGEVEPITMFIYMKSPFLT